LYQVDPHDGVGDTTVVRLGNEFEFLHVVEASADTNEESMVMTDFGYVSEEATEAERTSLMVLVNEFRGCFAKNLYELGCTSAMSVDIREIYGSTSLGCRPYKTSDEDREEIDKIVADWKRCGLVEENVSPYASPVLLIKQGGKNRLCVDY